MTPYLLVAETRTPDGSSLTLHKRGEEFHLRQDGQPLMSSRATASEEQMVDLGCRGEKGDEPCRYLIGGMGLGFTLRRLLKLARKKDKIHIAELVPAVVEWNRNELAELNGGALADERVRVITGDVFEQMKKVSGSGYDAIFLDVDNGPVAMTSQANARLYRKEGFQILSGALRPGGTVVFWSATRDGSFAKRLRQNGFDVEVIAAKAYEKAKKPTHTLFVGKRRGPQG